MSYCVNCGVELDSSAEKCPLCDTPVINPNINKNTSAETPFPQKVVIPPSTRKRYGAFIASLLILIPSIVCVITNLLITPHEHWSIYVVSSTAMIWFIFIMPFFIKKQHQFLTFLIDAVAVGAYIYVFSYFITSGKADLLSPDSWFFRIAVPIDITTFVIAGLLARYFRQKRNLISTIIAILASFMTYTIIIALIGSLFSQSVLFTCITVIIAVSTLIVLVFFVVVNKNLRLRAWLSRKFFF